MYNFEESIIEQVNNTKTEYDYDKTVIEFFEHQVSENPQHCAVLTESRSLTYKKANSLARYLREIGVRQNTIVGIMVPRSIEMIIGISAIILSLTVVGGEKAEKQQY